MISIAMATYNGEKYLREQLDSILAQTVQDFELVVCDDCSTDGTVRILKEYAQKNNRIKLFVNESNLGFAKNFERAISLCNGEFIALSDQDDVWLPKHLQVLLENIGEKDLCGADAVLVDEEGNDIADELTLMQNLQIEVLPETNEEFLFSILHQNFFQGASMLFRKRLVKKALPLPREVQFHDWWLALVSCTEGGISYVKIPVTRYRQHENNVTHNEKLSLCTRLKQAFVHPGASERLLSSIKTLQAFANRCPNILEIKSALEYHNDILLHPFRAALYLRKNYFGIYRNHKYGLLLLRTVKRLLGVLS